MTEVSLRGGPVLPFQGPVVPFRVQRSWRMAHMPSHEDREWDLAVRLRGAVGDGLRGGLPDCLYCVSAWVAVPRVRCGGAGRLVWRHGEPAASARRRSSCGGRARNTTSRLRNLCHRDVLLRAGTLVFVGG